MNFKGGTAVRVVPKSKESQLTFFQTHLADWQERAAEIGLTEAEVALLADRVTTAQTTYAAQQQAHQTARAATATCDTAVRAMTDLGATLIHQIRAAAGREGDMVYARAGLPVPATGSPIGPPGTPMAFTTELRPEGALVLRWRCRHPRGAEGTMYQVRRALDDGPMTFLGVVGKRAFLDRTLPPGTAQITYAVQAIRSTRTGNEAQHPVNLGVPAGHPIATQIARAA